MHVPLIDEIALICVIGVATTVVLSRLQLPAVTGLLLGGALLGPHAFGLVKSIDAIQVLAEIGVILLLFTIGLEFSLARLKSVFRQVAAGGVAQVALTTLVVAGVAMSLGATTREGIFYGFIFALSSTAIVLRGLAERRETDAPHGRFIVGTLIFQDLCVVPMVLIVPYLAPHRASGTDTFIDLGTAMGKAVVVVVITVAVARVIVPRVLDFVDASRSREAFLLSVIAICIGTAWLTSLVGLSLALGAFLGGMAVADSEYGHRAMGDVLPLRDAFVSIFFVSLGMLFDINVVIEHPLVFVGLLAGFVFLKGFLATIAALAMRFPPRVAWLAGVGLAQFGEFGFVLAELGRSSGVIDDQALRPVLAAGIVSMFFTPILVRAAPHFTAGETLLAPLSKLIGARAIDEVDRAEGHALTDHIVMVGYGLAGRLVADGLIKAGQKTVALELNAETVRAARERGEPAYYGDATSEEALGHAHVERAKAVVILINDTKAAERIVVAVRRVNPAVPIFIRAHYLAEGGPLQQAGASDVVAEEVEGGVEMLARVLRSVGAARNIIDARVAGMRGVTQPSARRFTIPRERLGESGALAGLKIEKVAILDGVPAFGQRIDELKLRARTGASIVAVEKDGVLVENPPPEFTFAVGDVVYLVGRGASLAAACVLLVGESSTIPTAVTAPSALT